MRPVSSRHSSSAASRAARPFAEPLKHLVVRDGMPGVLAAFRHDGAAHAVGGAAKRRVHRSGRPRRNVPDQRVVGALQVAGASMVGEGLPTTPCARASVFAATITPLVSLSSRCTMPGPLDPANAGKRIAAMMDQRIDQRAGPVAGAGMHDEPHRLVDHDQLVVLIEDVERDIFALRLRRLWLRQRDRHRLAGDNLAFRLGDRLAADASPRPA